LNEEDQTINGYFEVLEINQGYIKVRTKGGIVLIPMHRVLKIKLKEDLK